MRRVYAHPHSFLDSSCSNPGKVLPDRICNGLQDLEDLTQHLDATLAADLSAGSFTLGDADPLSRGAGQPTALSPDPFDALASASKQQHDMPFATYGQLVTPQVNPQQLGQSAASGLAEPFPADGASSTSSNSQQQQAAGPFSSTAYQQPTNISGPAVSGVEHLESLGSIPSPHLPQPVARDLPLVVTVSEPQRKEAAGVLGMKGVRQHCVGQQLLGP